MSSYEVPGMTPVEVAKHLGVSENMVRRALKSGELPCRKWGSWHVVRLKDAETWLHNTAQLRSDKFRKIQGSIQHYYAIYPPPVGALMAPIGAIVRLCPDDSGIDKGYDPRILYHVMEHRQCEFCAGSGEVKPSKTITKVVLLPVHPPRTEKVLYDTEQVWVLPNYGGNP